MLSTTLSPDRTESGICSSPSVPSTRICGVAPLSTIHSYNARNRYGREELIAVGPGAMDRWSDRLFFAEGPLDFGQAALEGITREHPLHVALYVAGRLGRHIDLVGRQAPEHRQQRTIDQAELIVQKERRESEQRVGLDDTVAQLLAGSGDPLRTARGFDDPPVLDPIAMDPVQRQPQARSRDRVDRHQRRV